MVYCWSLGGCRMISYKSFIDSYFMFLPVALNISFCSNLNECIFLHWKKKCSIKSISPELCAVHLLVSFIPIFCKSMFEGYILCSIFHWRTGSCLPVYASVFLSVCLSICLTYFHCNTASLLTMPTCPTFSKIHPTMHIAVCLFNCLFVPLHCLSHFLTVNQSMYLSVKHFWCNMIRLSTPWVSEFSQELTP